MKNMDLRVRLTASITGIHLPRPAGRSWPECVTWNTNVRQENRTMT